MKLAVEVQFEELTVDEQSSLVPREEEAAASWEELRAVSDCHLVTKPTSIYVPRPLSPLFHSSSFAASSPLLSLSSPTLALTGTSRAQ